MNIGAIFESLFGRACNACRRPESEVGELRAYPPKDREAATLKLEYCGPCAVRKAVRDTLEGRS